MTVVVGGKEYIWDNGDIFLKGNSYPCLRGIPNVKEEIITAINSWRENFTNA